MVGRAEGLPGDEDVQSGICGSNGNAFPICTVRAYPDPWIAQAGGPSAKAATADGQLCFQIDLAGAGCQGGAITMDSGLRKQVRIVRHVQARQLVFTGLAKLKQIERIESSSFK